MNSRFSNHLQWIMLMLVVIWCSGLKAEANMSNTADSLKYKQFKGSVIDMESRKALGFATLTLEGTNLSTVANSEGEFSFKVPVGQAAGNVVVSYLGHKDKILSLTVLKPERNRIEL